MKFLLFLIFFIFNTNSQSVQEYLFNGQRKLDQSNQTSLQDINSNSTTQSNQTNFLNENIQKDQEQAAFEDQQKNAKKLKLQYAKNISKLIQKDQDEIHELQEEISYNQNLGSTEVTELMKEEETLKKHLREQKKIYSQAIYESNHQNLLEKNNIIKERQLQQLNVTVNQTNSTNESKPTNVLDDFYKNASVNQTQVNDISNNTNMNQLNVTENSTNRLNFNLTKEQKLLRKRVENQEKRMNESKALDEEQNIRAVQLFEEQLEAKLKARWQKEELEYKIQQMNVPQNPQQFNRYQDTQQYTYQDHQQVAQQQKAPYQYLGENQIEKNTIIAPQTKHLNQFNDIDHIAYPKPSPPSQQMALQTNRKRLHTMISFLQAPYYAPQSQDEIDRQKKMQGKQTTNLKSPFQAVSKIISQENLTEEPASIQQEQTPPLQEEVVPKIQEKKHFETQEISIDQNDPSIYEKRTKIKVNLMRMPNLPTIEKMSDGDKWMSEQASKNPLNHPLIIQSTKEDDEQDMLVGGMPLELSKNSNLQQKQLRENKIIQAHVNMNSKNETLVVKNNTEISQVNHDKIEMDEQSVGGYSTVIMPQFSPALLKKKSDKQQNEPQQTMYSDQQIQQIRLEKIKEQNELNLQHDMAPSIIV